MFFSVCFSFDFVSVLCSVAGHVFCQCCCATARGFEVQMGQMLCTCNSCVWKQDLTVSLSVFEGSCGCKIAFYYLLFPYINSNKVINK